MTERMERTWLGMLTLTAGALMIWGAQDQWGSSAGLFAAGIWLMLVLIYIDIRQAARAVAFISEYQLEGPGRDRRRRLGWRQDEDA
jgi:hypothetical protein